MGIFDDAVPGGNVGKPLMIALGALLVSRFLSSRKDQPEQGQDKGVAQSEDGGLLGGMDGLLDKLRNSGHGDKADSWVGSGDNKPIAKDDLGDALGSDIVKQLAEKTGMPEEELLKQLSAVLPGLVDKLTPAGKTPESGQIASALRM
nr:YidB family protein [Chelativorans xinjiangense]